MNLYNVNKLYLQRGGGKCSLCGAPNTNKSTCPFNPNAKKKNPSNHNDKPLQKANSKEKSTSNKLTDILKSGYTFNNLNITILKQLTDDLAPSLIYLVKDNINGNEYVLKAEPINTTAPQIYNEMNIIRSLTNNINADMVKELIKDKSIKNITYGIPKIRLVSNQRSDMIMYIDENKNIKLRMFLQEKLDTSLRQLMNNKKFSVSEIKKMAIQLIEIIQFIHSKGIIHLDIKPANIMKKNNHFYIIDYGISKTWVINKYDSKTRTSKNVFRKGIQSGEGTYEYRSIDGDIANIKIDKKKFISRNNDIEALGYILYEMYFGRLPWSKYKPTEIQKVVDAKKNSVKNLGSIKDKGLRDAITIMINSYKLPFDTEPEYKKLINKIK